MTNYRRLISYIYAYEGEIKGKNIGFAKLESRNGQCKLSVNVKKVYVGSSDLGVYLLAPDQEIFLGSIFIRGGSGEFRAAIAVDNAADSGCSMDQCHGLTIHEKGESWRSYTTIWEDAVAQAAELDLAGVTSENRGNADDQIHKKMKELAREIKAQEHALGASSVQEPDSDPEIIDIPSGPEAEEPVSKTPAAGEPEIEVSEVNDSLREIPAPEEPEAEAVVYRQEGVVQESSGRGVNPAGFGEKKDCKPRNQEELAVERQWNEPAALEMPSARNAIAADVAAARAMAMSRPESREQPDGADEEKEQLPLGDPMELARLEEEEQECFQPQQLWEEFRKRYPKIQAFNSANGCEILTIKPQDIGLLPRENWNYGNNSFLLHGYYNYRYLVLARVGGEGGSRLRYILGVPGHYYSNEKYMASMFGFPHFVLSKKQPSQDGRFGYWYTDIRLQNQD